jgi:hypothetical protein
LEVEKIAPQMKPAIKFPKKIRGYNNLAALIQQKFGIPCNKMTIKGWQTRPTGNRPKFTVPDPVRNEFEVAECFAWVEKYVPSVLREASKNGKSDKELRQLEMLEQKTHAAKSSKQIVAAEREAWEFEREKGEWIRRDESENTIKAAMKMYHNFVRTELESLTAEARREKLQQLGVAPEIVAQFYEFDLAAARNTTDRIEKRCEGEAG